MRADLITRALAVVIDRSADARTSDGAQTGISMIERREVRQRGAFALRRGRRFVAGMPDSERDVPAFRLSR